MLQEERPDNLGLVADKARKLGSPDVFLSFVRMLPWLKTANELLRRHGEKKAEQGNAVDEEYEFTVKNTNEH